MDIERLSTPEGMIDSFEVLLKESNYVLDAISKLANNETTSEKDRNNLLNEAKEYRKLNQMLEDKIQEQKERIKRGETSSIDKMSPSELIEEVEKLRKKLMSLANLPHDIDL